MGSEGALGAHPQHTTGANFLAPNGRAHFRTKFHGLLQLFVAWLKAFRVDLRDKCILALADYYQVQFVKESCAGVFAKLQVTPSRLVKARKFGLLDLSTKWCGEIANSPEAFDLTALEGSADMLLEVATHMQKALIKRNGSPISSIESLVIMLENAKAYVGDAPASPKNFNLYQKLSDALRMARDLP